MQRPIKQTHGQTHFASLVSMCQWRIQDFPEGGTNPKGRGTPTYYLTNFPPKLHENEEIVAMGGVRPSPPP